MKENAHPQLPPAGWERTRRVLTIILVLAFLYVVSFTLDSYSGGYWNKLERDGHDRWSFGASMHTAVLWQPRFGYWALYRSDLLGSFYSPLIQLDRQFVHHTHYVSDPEFPNWAKTLIVKDWHPQFHAEAAKTLGQHH